MTTPIELGPWLLHLTKWICIWLGISVVLGSALGKFIKAGRGGLE
jgi:hypothetical protein